jgi:hypothetical protein
MGHDVEVFFNLRCDLLKGKHAPSGGLRERIKEAAREAPLFDAPEPAMRHGVGVADPLGGHGVKQCTRRVLDSTNPQGTPLSDLERS